MLLWYIFNLQSFGKASRFNKCRRFLSSSWESFSVWFWKMAKFHFWANVMLRQPHIQASRASPAQKLQGVEDCSIPKTFQGLHFLFSRDLNMFLSYLPVKQILLQSAVWYLTSYLLQSYLYTNCWGLTPFLSFSNGNIAFLYVEFIIKTTIRMFYFPSSSAAPSTVKVKLYEVINPVT